MGNCCHNEERRKVRSDEEKKNIISRLNRIAGQIAGVKKMVEEDRYCDDVLIQLSAIDKAVKSLAGVLLDAHMHTCLVSRIQAGEIEVVDEISDLFKRFS